MSTFTDKELIKEIKERIGSLDVRDNIERRAYEIALASLEAEPVAWLHSDNGLGIPAITRSKNIADSWLSKGWYVQSLYVAQPLPVVPEEKPMPNPLSMYAVDAVAAIAEVRGWNACRAAMLHSAEPVSQTYKLHELSGNSPVIPDGWISCSERMPEETGDIIVVSDGIVMSGISYSRRDGFYIAALEYDDDEPIDGVTHWMPLPEPPQEVK
ncbi:DUF551 domain-containing protein [Escherichia coli]|uniref:DUF551 domain-containing protein n=1 Tax=Escherichia coli TaxID=562 RepID=UPI000BE569F0|nr:DUF551 domain-containing protein [Escherichia coli]MED0521080.1 DUF551 domain-containing protein [Escherichia coli]MED8878420.1 DUF551 domain-containing protein [Escherichia coli]MED8934481.1 DUF551 domain-containing protein [Escherichia coli]HAL1057417.1 DUF551 domain-containing protein [Escherichia coli]HAM7588165.1 DUF551 domain-containing protein [Escherichia coli]